MNKKVKQPFPKQLVNIAAYLRKEQLALSAQSEDGRVNSVKNEEEVLNCIRRKFDVDKPRARKWYDFVLDDGNASYPVNIKVTTTDSIDNLNCKLGIYYALTGLLPDFVGGIGYESYFEKLQTNLGHSQDKDYYFLVVNKQDPSDVFVNSLRGLQDIVPNGNNPPFQCKWSANRDYQKRTFDEAKDFILSTMGVSIKLRADAYISFKKYFPDICITLSNSDKSSRRRLL